MSNSDDTDLLLFIPPDFFLIGSDSDDDLDFSHSLKQHPNEVERSVVSDLITQVNDLESRICMIEGNSSNLQSCNDSQLNCSIDCLSVYQSICSKLEPDKQSENNKWTCDSMDNMSRNNKYMYSNDYHTNIKSNQHFSLPPTPSREVNSQIIHRNLSESDGTVNYGSQFGKSSIKNESQRNKGSINECSAPNISYNHSLSYDHGEPFSNRLGKITDLSGHHQHTKHVNSQKEADILYEIDDYLHRVQRGDEAIKSPVKQQYKSTVTNTRSVLTSKPDIRYDASRKTTSEYVKYSSPKQLELPEVERLLREMETTQSEIEQKLKTREIKLGLANKERENMLHLKGPSLLGDNVCSIPDLGFGLRDMNVLSPISSTQRPYNHNDAKTPPSGNPDEITPVEEAPCIVKRISKLGSGPQSVSKVSERGSYTELPARASVITPAEMGSYSASPAHAPVITPQQNEVPNIQSNRNHNYRFTPRRCLNLNSEESNTVQPADGKQLSNTQHQTTSQISNYEPQVKNYKSEQMQDQGNYMNDAGDGICKWKDVLMKREVQMLGQDTNKINPVSSHPITTSSNLISLSELWNDNQGKHCDDPAKLQTKLEEERCRRLHCENLIQGLQWKVLEEQEKVAVAVRVDAEKDRAIKEISEAWRRLASHWGELEEQRHSLAQQLAVQRNTSKLEVDQVLKKVELSEKEVAQVLDLAAGYKAKCEAIEKEREALKGDLESQIAELVNKLDDAVSQVKHLLKERNELSDTLELSNQQYDKISDPLSKRLENCLIIFKRMDKKILEDREKEIKKLKSSLVQCESEVVVVKEQKESLTTKLKDERARNGHLDQQKAALRLALEEVNKKEKISREEAKVCEARIESTKKELRLYYQAQLESVVKDKLKEFQSQLDAAETSLRAEIEAKEKSFAQQAAAQCQALVDKHRVEKARVEGKWREEVRRLEEKLAESEKKRNALEFRQQEIAKQLHAVMENQWQQAYKIITTDAPIQDGPHPNPTHAKWANSTAEPREDKQRPVETRLDLRDLHSRASSTSTIHSEEQVPFGKEGQTTYRMANQPPPKEDQLKRYIQMLLDRSPGNPEVGGPVAGIRWKDISMASGTLDDDYIRRQDQSNSIYDASKPNQAYGKPPWK